MNNYSIWRYVLILVLIVLGLLYAAPNLYGTDPAIQVSPKGTASLQGVKQQAQQVLQQHQITPVAVAQENGNLLIRFTNTTTQLKAQDLLQAVLGKQYTVAANLAANTPKWLQSLGAYPMRLGLDLQGGIHFLLSVDVNSMVKQRQQGDMHSMVSALRDKDIHYSQVDNQSKAGIVFGFKSGSDADNAISVLSSRFPTYEFKKRTGAKGKVNVQAKISYQALVDIRNYAIEQNLNILRNRVNALGVAEPVIRRQGPTDISVDLPGVQDSARAKNLIGKVATVRMQLVDTSHDPNGPVPFGSTLYQYHQRPVLLKNQVILRGTSIVSATPSFDQNGKPAVSIRLNGNGVSLFNQVTGENVGKPMAVVYVETVPVKKLVDGKVVVKHQQKTRIISIASINSALGNDFQIMGLTSTKEAQNLGLLLRSGAYTAPVDFVAEHLVGPTLGKENIHLGVLSTEIGALLVILFMAFYYRVFGLIANMALVLNVIFIVAIMSVLGMTLTLPGIAGIVLTIGMAVDANVLINERIREELRLGMSPKAAIQAGYGRAFMTIVDANVTTLIVAVVLFALGSGSVQGFAVTLIVGLLTSMVTAIFFTRALVNLIYGKRQIKQLSIGIKVK